MFDHVGFSTPDYAGMTAFYAKALAPLGITCLMEVTEEMTGGEAFSGFGRERPQLWIGTGERHEPGIHIAFTAESRAAVDAFHAAALAAGGRDNGQPGLRPKSSSCTRPERRASLSASDSQVETSHQICRP